MFKLYIVILLSLGIQTSAQDKTTRARDLPILASGRHYFTKGEIKHGKDYFLNIIEELRRKGDKETEVLIWEELSQLISSRDTADLTKIYCLERAAALHQQLNNSEKAIEMLQKIAIVHLNVGRLDTAEAGFFRVLNRYKAINFPYLHYTYDLLGVTYRYKGDFNKAIFYGLKSVESFEATRDTFRAAAVLFYSRLANMYRELDQTENSIKWYWRVFEDRVYTGPVNLYMFRDAGFLVRELIKLNKKKEALAFILDVADKNVPIGIYADASLTSTLAYCYHVLSKDKMAEKYYMKLVALIDRLAKNNEVTADVNYELGQYFFDRRQFEKASFHLFKALDVSSGINSPSTIKDIHLKLYTTDSAKGEYLSAINHLRTYKAINDAIFNEKKSKQIEELKVQYETVQKENDIKLLNNQNQLQEIELRQANKARNITLVGISLLLIIAGLLYNGYRLKQRTNEKLKVQQTEIEEQNLALRHLLNEKEWLLKEIHHRVKNNLQIVMSLLNSQSAYIDNEPALTAIHDSQHRVHAMSLIHQKLYGSDNLSSIDMSVYIRELVSYLADSFNTAQRIRFTYDIEPLAIDVSEAVPLGLILNEAITNSIKYAFPDGRTGLISISLATTSADHYLLSISDNGIGLPSQFNNKKPGSLGMSLISGLSEDLNGDFYIRKENGTTINISFAHDQSMKRRNTLAASFASSN